MAGLTRRATLAALLPLAALSLTPALAQADWPARPIRLLVPFPPGGAADIPARLMVEHLGKALGASFVVDNRPGGNTMIAAEAAARSAPDGYTFLFCSNSTMASVPALVPNAPYSPERDFAPVGLVSRAPFFVIVPANLPAQNMRELIQLARQQPGKLSYGSNGNGTSGNLHMELLKQAEQLDIVHIPYRGYAQALNDMLGGRIQVMLADLTVVGGALEAGQIRALAAAGPERSGFFPDLPTVVEATGLANFDSGVWFGLFAPAGVAQPIIQRINTAMLAWLRLPETRAALGRVGQVPEPGTAEQLRETVRRDGARYARLIRQTGVTMD